MKRFLLKVLIGTVLFAHLAMVSIFIFHEVFDFTSSNSALYFLRGKTGGIEITRDLILEDADRLIFMLDASYVFHYLMRGVAIAKGTPVLELTWDSKEGRGDIKEFLSDGKFITLSFSRFREGKDTPRGLFLGGDLPYGDVTRAEQQQTSGFGYYDGEQWFHIWCAANEGFSLAGKSSTIVPTLWKFRGSRVIKHTNEEVILESSHEAKIEGQKIYMRRFVQFRAGENYFTLKIRIINPNTSPLTYGLAYGDEPWVGSFGASTGDIGWYADGLIKYETFISPHQYSYAGFWNHGNDAAGEDTTGYSNCANFIEWVSPRPSYVFLSNSLANCCQENVPLYSIFNRSINIVWLNMLLLPGDSKDHILIIGMAEVDPLAGIPVKPATVVR